MPQLAADSYRYAVLRYVYDAKRDLAAPAGVVVWGHGDARPHFRIMADDESVPELRGHDALFYLNEAVDRLNEWVDDGMLPFSDKSLSPDSDEWWLAAKRILHHRVRLSSPMPVDCVDAEAETDLLFEAVVAPKQLASRRRQKLASAIDEGLGPELARVFSRRARTAAYRQNDATVSRLYETASDRVVVEAINLASRQLASQESYNLVGKARWITDSGKVARFVIGYLSSPGGLNGEADYKAWIEERLDTTCYDLVRERDGFRLEVERLVEEMDPQRRLPDR